MRAIDRLKRSARESASWRGHTLGRFSFNVTRNGRATACAECTRCKMWVGVDTRPAPNGIDIGGEAVALNCTGSK